MVLVIQQPKFEEQYEKSDHKGNVRTPKGSNIEPHLLKKYEEYLDFVVQKITDEKVFFCENFMDFETIRKALRKRGFIESCSHPWHTIVPFRVLLEKADTNNEYEKALISYLIGKHPPDYMFITPANSYYHTYDNVRVLSMLKFNETNFGLKDGLCDCINKINWYLSGKAAPLNVPRSYDVIDGKELQMFHQDFRLTIVTSIVLYLNEQNDMSECFCPDHGTIKSRVIDFVFYGVETRIKQEEGLLARCSTSDILEIVWGQIYQAYTDLIKKGKKIKVKIEDIPEYIKRVKCLTEEIYHYWPSRKHDGFHNVWLLKPARTGQGHGIILSDDEQDIIDIVKRQKTKYVCQKYIEKVSLVKSCKYDLRQYFLIVIDDTHLRCFSHWICSVKFASQPYTLDDFDESVHITNACIQQKYQDNKGTDLPILWTLNQLIEYYVSIGKPTVWQDEIYPFIKNTIISIVKASVDGIDLRPGRFELFGNDWIITDDFKPYLLEVNRCPGLNYYSPVSKIVCGTIMEDLIKVTVDYNRDKQASTGGFELIYEMQLPNKLNVVDTNNNNHSHVN